MSDKIEKAPGLDAAKREQWAREALRGTELRTKRFGEFVAAVRELMAALPKCEHVRDPDALGGNDCDRPATMTDRTCYWSCDTHIWTGDGEWGVKDLDYATALRKLQAMLDPEETEKP